MIQDAEDRVPMGGGCRRCKQPLTTAMILVLLAGLIPFSATGQIQDLLERGPIYITSDLDFTPANGVVGGIGTAESPFLIDGWTITANPINPLVGPGAAGPNAAVEIVDTTAYFVVSNLTIAEPGDFLSGIRLYGVANAELQSNMIAGFGVAIDVKNVTATAILANTLVGRALDPDDESSSSRGIAVAGSQGVLVQGNDLSGPLDFGIKLDMSDGVTVDGNVIHDTTRAAAGAISVYRGSAIIVRNVVSGHGGAAGAWAGIEAEAVKDIVVSGNDVRDTLARSRPVISLRGENVVVEANQVSASEGFSEVAIFVHAYQEGLVARNRLDGSGGMDLRGGRITTANNLVKAGTPYGIAVSQVDEWTTHDDEVSGVVRPSNGAVPSGVWVSQTNRTRVFALYVHDNEGVGVSFIGGDVEVEGLVVERNEVGGISIAGVNRAVFRSCTVRDNGGEAVRVGADANGRESTNVDLDACGIAATSESTSRPETSEPGRDVPIPMPLGLVAILVAGARWTRQSRRSLRGSES